MLVVHFWAPFQPLSIQDDTFLVVREHVACLEALQEAVVVVTVPLADLAVHLQPNQLF